MNPRPRGAALADGPACIPLLTEAGGELLVWCAGDLDVARALLERCWSHAGHPLGPGNTTVVEQDGQIVGVMLGAPVRHWNRAEQRHPISLEGLAPKPVLTALLTRLRQQRAARPPLPESGWYLSSLGVDPAFRRRGLARGLLIQATRRARVHDCAGLVLEVVADNVAARTLYEQGGFAERQRWTPPDGPEVVRLWRDL